MNTTLWPPISSIYSNLFAALDDPKNPSLDDTVTPADIPAVSLEEIVVPTELREMFRRRAAAQAQYGDEPPHAGQIRCIQHPSLHQHVAILLLQPLPTDSLQWQGLVVAPSGEMSYVSDRDLVLDSDDEPCDPLAGFVQVWNPITWPIAHTGRILCTLSTQRFNGVQAMLAAMAQQPWFNAQAAQPGRVGLSPLGAHNVVSGTPLAGPNDTRWHYQQLYLALVEHLTPSGPLGQLISQMRQGMSARTLQAQPEIDYAMAGTQAPCLTSHYLLGDCVQLHMQATENQLIALQFRCLDGECLIREQVGTMPPQNYVLTPQAPPQYLLVDPQDVTQLDIYCRQQLLLTLNMPF